MALRIGHTNSAANPRAGKMAQLGAGVAPPACFQGPAFLGPQETPPQEYIYGARDRMDEAYDLIRTVRDKRFRYFRNYMPYVTYAQDIDYMNEMPMLQDLRRLHTEGKLDGDQEKWFAPTKPLEELYDVEADPHELNNLATHPEFQSDLYRLRAVHLSWMASTDDVGLIPEPELDAWRNSAGTMTAQAPVLTLSEEKILMSSSTPGASISYRWEDDVPDYWRLDRGGVAVRPGVRLHAKASRIGFKDSIVVTVGEAGGGPSGVTESHPVDAESLGQASSGRPKCGCVCRCGTRIGRLGRGADGPACARKKASR